MKESGQDDSGLKALLGFSSVYDLFQEHLLGGKNARRWLATHFWKLEGGETVVDLGCGTATILEYLPPDIEYLGVDISENYILAARKRFPTRRFFLGTAVDLLDHHDSCLSAADVVLCNGLLHHLCDEEAITVLESSKRILKPNGRLLCLEATYLARQTRLSRCVVSTDRGKYVRSEQEWKCLMDRAFRSYSTKILTGLIRIPYTHIIIECINDQSLPD